MNSKIIFPDVNAARIHYGTVFKTVSDNTFKALGLDRESLDKLDIPGLKSCENLIDELLQDEAFINSRTFVYAKDEAFSLQKDSKALGGFRFSIKTNLFEVKKYIKNKINEIEEKSKVESIEHLIKDLPENSAKVELLKEIDELKNKKSELENQQKQTLDQINTQIELNKHKIDYWKDKSDIILKFLDKDFVATFVGAILLLIMS